ncbi:molybdenum cofactor guanylyltransferase [Parasporobacterium paucivorans]|uniref:Probable molybdenum cofactor guanylyltransferase n=1 Tax=Parasporobacterium paucivorans DSM 15970 TaxID=1122934 RepID=A0A1M6BGG7_9FIRM|nr:molybdenum cofactor guanylyltransferase [Parasporobacterium paucivorans]SHI47563.1 molybdopterin-guanine dinucleotide biosynthesis protein A [Parasporobacterium paucivorans DSM 15970]
MNQAIVILTGGKSSRMGTDKGLLTINGHTFIEELYDKFSPNFENVILSVDKKPKYAGLNLDLVEIEDIVDCAGPMGGLYSIFKQTDYSEIFVVSVDTPFVSVRAALALIDLSSGHDICIMENADSRLEPLFGVYRRSCLNQIEKLLNQGDHSMTKLCRNCDVKIIPQNSLEYLVTEKMDDCLVNLNTKTEYTKYVKKQ